MAAEEEQLPITGGGASAALESSQNSEEDGVFVSDAALQHGSQQEQVDRATARLLPKLRYDGAKPRRRLLALKRAPPSPPDFGDGAALEVRAFACKLLHGQADKEEEMVAEAAPKQEEQQAFGQAWDPSEAKPRLLGAEATVSAPKVAHESGGTPLVMQMRAANAHPSASTLLSLPFYLGIVSMMLLYAMSKRLCRPAPASSGRR